MINLPASLLNDLSEAKGFNEGTFIAAHAEAPTTSVRSNPYKEVGLFGSGEAVPWCDAGRYLNERPVFTLDPFFHAGAYYVQEASSMFLAYMWRHILADAKGLRVLDLCAAPGGKSTLIASLLDKDSLLISNEVIRARATILDENITRWGYMNTWVTANEPRDFGRLDGYFDVIVTDAPCSGSGLFRKDPGALAHWSETNVQLCGERQQKILADVWPSLKENGILIYATCSYSPQEDEQILDWLAGAYDIETIEVPVPEAWGVVSSRSAKGLAAYRFFPDKVKGEGLFIAAIRKKEETGSEALQRFKSGHDKKIQQHAGYLLKDPEVIFMQTGKEEYNALRPAHEQDWQILQKLVYFRRVGLRLGEPAGKDWLPAHDVALGIDANSLLPGIEVSREQALRFLRREDMGIEDIARGWQVIRYKGLGLGWIKSLGNRINNYLPKHWRIRMEITDIE
jgi:16S rRNA C967 or C1407 C5-methylase (RsmB/RsmF family)/NOL1/NOP2/fmu family ribosome biogenesis protein